MAAEGWQGTSGVEMTVLTPTATLGPEDLPRLKTLLERVQRLMVDEQWRTLDEIRCACGGSEASCSARLRDLRKRGFEVERQRVTAGLWKYRVLQPHGQRRLFS